MYRTAKTVSGVVLLGAVFLSANPARAQPEPDKWYVDTLATGGNNGLTWTDAFTDLQDALTAARAPGRCTEEDLCEIWVAVGTYLPGNKMWHTFELVDNVHIFGGFCGTACNDGAERERLQCLGGPGQFKPCTIDRDCESCYGGQRDTETCCPGGEECVNGFCADGSEDPPECCPGGVCDTGPGNCWDVREWAIGESILSGDLDGDDEIYCNNPGDTCEYPVRERNGTCDEEGLCREDVNGYILTRNNGNSKHVVTVREGTPDTVLLDGFTITGGNSTAWSAPPGDPEPGGGGIRLIELGQATFQNCIIKQNEAYNGGGGVYSYGDLDSRFINCLITENWARGPFGHGGGIGAKIASSPEIINCRIVANRAKTRGGGLHLTVGGGETAIFRIYNTVIADNRVIFPAADSGGLYFAAGWLEAGLEIVNSTIVNNRVGVPNVGGTGGGIYARGGNETYVNINNSVIAGNEAGSNPQIFVTEIPTFNVRYSNIQRDWDGSEVGPGAVTFLEGNLGTEESQLPRFANAGPDHDFALGAKSVGIDAGNNDLIPPDFYDLDRDGLTSDPLPFDVMFEGRVHDDVGMVDLGDPGTPPDFLNHVVDMGAYEFHGVSLAAPTTDGIGKNRYLSIQAPPNPSGWEEDMALRVLLKDLPEGFEAYEGQVRWIYQVDEICENSGKGPETDPEDCPAALPTDTFMVATLDPCEPVLIPVPYYAWEDWPAVGLMQVYDEIVVPGAVYEIQALPLVAPLSEALFSPPLTVTTNRWGDVCGPGPGGACTGDPDQVVDVANDVCGVLEKFANSNNLQKAMADVDHNEPDRKVSVSNDVLWVLDAFGGGSYPFSGPDPCWP